MIIFYHLVLYLIDLKLLSFDIIKRFCQEKYDNEVLNKLINVLLRVRPNMVDFIVNNDIFELWYREKFVNWRSFHIIVKRSHCYKKEPIEIEREESWNVFSEKPNHQILEFLDYFIYKNIVKRYGDEPFVKFINIEISLIEVLNEKSKIKHFIANDSQSFNQDVFIDEHKNRIIIC